ncbi:MAG: pyrrolo-quinoline quinone [Planctomycetia bacterium]|nr:pyrrolo-quinoline quinone [Planctomycetia bacterium]
MRATRRLPLLAAAMLWSATAAAADWPEFLGPGGCGVADGQAIRTRWSETEGIAWKVDLPGRAASSPIIVGDLVVVTASSGPRQDQLHIVALDRATGRTVWHRRFWATGRTLVHPTSAVAAGTPASDGERIVALFSSCDLFAVDLAGRLLWQRNLAVEHPRSGNDVGMGSSPRIVDGTVVVQIDCQGDAFTLGVDAASGIDRWIVPREKLASWTSPLGLSLPGHGACVLLQGQQGLDLRRAGDGVQVWSWQGACAGIPVAARSGSMVLVPGDGLVAVVPTAADAAPAWRSSKLSCGIASPLAWGDSIACINRAGVLGIGAAADGQLRGQVRLAGSFWASPILVGTTIVAVNKEGKTFLVSAAGEPKIVAENELPGTFTATPAVADGSLYLRSETALWKVAAP